MSDYVAKEEGTSEVEGALSNADSLKSSLNKLMLDLPHINRGPRAYVSDEKTESWGPTRYLLGNDVDGSDGTLSEDYSVPNETDGDDSSRILLRCQFCDFDVMVYVKHYRLEDVYIFDPEKMICPACDEKFGEDTINFVHNSIVRKRAWNSDKYNSLYRISATTDNKLSSWGKSNVSVPRLKSSSSDSDSDEDSISIYSDTSYAKSSETELAADTSDEQEQEEQEEDKEKSLRAKFVRDLVLSTMI